MSAHAMLAWLWLHKCRVRFHSNKTVEVTLNHSRRRRKTLEEAILAHDPVAEKFMECRCFAKPHTPRCPWGKINAPASKKARATT